MLEVKYLNNEKFKNENMEILSITIFMSLYAVLGIYMFPVILAFFPAAFIYLGVKRGSLQSIVSMALVCLITGIMVDMLSGVIIFFIFMPVTYAISDGIKSRKRPWEPLAISTIVLFLSILVLYGFAQNIAGVNIVSQMEESFKLIIQTQTEIYKDMGLSDFELIKTMNLLESTYKNILVALPSIIMLISFVISYCSYYISVVLLRKSGQGIIYIPRFSRFKLPKDIIPGIIAMYSVVIFIYLFSLPYYQVILTNITFLVYSMIIIQGLSVIDFYMLKSNVKIYIRILLILILSIIAPIGMLISIIGIADTIFDLRRLRRPKS